MNDMLFLILGVLGVGFIYTLSTIAEHFQDCGHRWSKWQDPVRDQAWLWQFRVCEKCNMQECRKVQ